MMSADDLTRPDGIELQLAREKAAEALTDGTADTAAADGDTHAGWAALGRVAVVAVGQDDDDREDQHLEERPEDVARRQE